MHQIEPITSSRRSTPKERNYYYKSESHLDPQTTKSLCYSIPSGTSTCLTTIKKKRAEMKETTLFSSDRQYPIMKDKWVNCTAN